MIATSTAVFSEAPVTLEEQREWLQRRRESGFPVLVVRDGDAVLAYATYGEFRPHSGYRTTVEHTVHVAAGARRRGIGRALVMRLLELAREDGRHVMVAGVDAANAPSIALHEAARLRRVRPHDGDRAGSGAAGSIWCCSPARLLSGAQRRARAQAAGTATGTRAAQRRMTSAQAAGSS